MIYRRRNGYLCSLDYELSRGGALLQSEFEAEPAPSFLRGATVGGVETALLLTWGPSYCCCQLKIHPANARHRCTSPPSGLKSCGRRRRVSGSRLHLQTLALIEVSQKASSAFLQMMSLEASTTKAIEVETRQGARDAAVCQMQQDLDALDDPAWSYLRLPSLTKEQHPRHPMGLNGTCQAP